MTASSEPGLMKVCGWRTLVDDFEVLLQTPTEGRDEALLSLERHNPSRADILRSMLAHDARGTSSSPLLPDLDGILDPILGSGDLLGTYRIDVCVGTGGMGRVYRATGDRDGIPQTVAIKCLRYPGLSPLRIDRFLRERRIMARLSHPNIARFIDAGVDHSGQPFVVMEYVEGLPINEYCRVHALGVRARLELLTQVLQALDYAHRQLVVHRDIKPGNVLVTADGRPVLLDFGIASVVYAESTQESVLATQPGQRHYTPNYAAPEQWVGEETGVATDVYAAGVLLYELLAGQPPIQLHGLRFELALDRVLHQIPPPPSPALVKTFALDGLSLDVSSSMLQDLNTVVLHAMKKQPSERYPSVDALRADVKRILDCEPISIRAGHRWYWLQTFVRRNRKIVWSSAVLGVLLLSSAVLLVWQERQARQLADEYRRIAELNASVLRQIDLQESGRDLSANVTAGLRTGLIRAGVQGAELEARLERFAEDWTLLDPAGQVGKMLQTSLLDPGVSAINQEFAGTPLTKTRLLRSMATNYSDIGMTDRSLEIHKEILKVLRENLPADSAQVRFAAGSVGADLMRQGNYADAEQFLLEAVAPDLLASPGEEANLWDAVTNLGQLRFYQSRFSEAEDLFRRAITGFAVAGLENSDSALAASGGLGTLLTRQQRHAEALVVVRDVLARNVEIYGPTHHSTLVAQHNLGATLINDGKLAEGLALFAEVVRIRAETLGINHPDTVSTKLNYAEVLRMNGQPINALRIFEEILPQIAKQRGASSRSYLAALALHSFAVRDSGDLEKAEPLLREALGLYQEHLGLDEPETIAISSQLGTLLQMKGEFAEAERLFQQALAKRAELLGPRHQTTLRSSNALARLYVQIQRHAAALELLEPLADAMRAEHEVQGKSENWCKYLTQTGRAHLGLQAWGQAVQRLEQAEAVCVANPNASIGERRDCLEGLVELYSRVPQQSLNQPKEQRLQAVRALLVQLEEKRRG